MAYLPTISTDTKTTLATVSTLKDLGQDFEWYPTTDEMIKAVSDDILGAFYEADLGKILDIGAGDGRVLTQLKSHILSGSKQERRYVKLKGLEKSSHHANSYGSKNIVYCGSDFHNESLYGIEHDVLFCNPPYSEYENWVSRLIRTCNSSVQYFVIPERWANSEAIENALRHNNKIAEVIYTGDFNNAERKARAKVNIVRVISEKQTKIYVGYGEVKELGEYTFNAHEFYAKQDGFDNLFQASFPKLSNEENRASAREEADSLHLVTTETGVQKLVELYSYDKDRLFSNYQKLEELDAELFVELNISIDGLKKSLKSRLSQLHIDYWQKVFDMYDPIREVLTKKYRKIILDGINVEELDFNLANIQVITEHTIKKAIVCQDEQLIDLYKELARKKGIKLYKSNERVFTSSDWNWSSGKYASKEDLTHYGLDYRIIGYGMMGMYVHDDSWNSRPAVVSLNSYLDFQNDFQILAKACGLVTDEKTFNGAEIPPLWKGYDGGIPTGEKLHATGYDHTIDKIFDLFTFKAFKNGNIHIQMNKEFALRMNVLIGKLLGWVKSAEQAIDEMQLPASDAKKVKSFYDEVGSDNLLTTSDEILKIGFSG